jgi:uncharacterized protein YgfB (UPF0149 family)
LSDFDACADALLAAGLSSSPAEAHGTLCGLLGGGFSGAAADALDALQKCLDVELVGPAADYCTRSYEEAAAQLATADEAFHPLLPDNAYDLDQRVAALALWCRGFLNGYAQARVGAGTADATVAADSAEALRDFAAIAQAEAPRSDEQAEVEYAELVAYLSVAAPAIIADSAAALREQQAGRAQSGAGTPGRPH